MARPRDLVAAAAVALTLAACSTPTARDPGATGTAGTSTPGAASDLVELTNVQRSKVGLSPLRVNPALEHAARIQAEEIAAIGRLEHTVSGAEYPRLEDRMAAVGYRWRLIGENLARGQTDAAAAFDTWMGSPPHRGNILNDEFVDIGTAQVSDRNGSRYYVQVFARPAS
jgi:uncharacterized protein YkwD